jgi:hypothetical protein
MIFVQLCTPFVELGDYFPFVQSRRLLARQNEQLRHDNDLLRQEVRALSETGRENLRLRQLLDFKEHSAFHTVTARVIGRDASNWWKSLQIDRGSRMVWPTTWPCSMPMASSAKPSPSPVARRACCCSPTQLQGGGVVARHARAGSGVRSRYRLQPVAASDHDLCEPRRENHRGRKRHYLRPRRVFPKGILIGTTTRARMNGKPACIRMWTSLPRWIFAGWKK